MKCASSLNLSLWRPSDLENRFEREDVRFSPDDTSASHQRMLYSKAMSREGLFLRLHFREQSLPFEVEHRELILEASL